MVENPAADRAQAHAERILAQRQFIAFQSDVLRRIVAQARDARAVPQISADPAACALAHASKGRD